MKRLVVAVVAGLLLAGAGVAVAGSGGSGSVFTGCLKKDGKIERVAIGVTPLKRCKSNETQITWNATGPAGLMGPRGPQGLAGQDGVDGQDGRDGTDGADGQPCSVADHGDGTATLACPDGSSVLIPTLRVLAIAYSNTDGVDGFSPAGDVLIFKLVDIDGDEMVSVGDKVVMGRYPKDFAATTFGIFGRTSHRVTYVISADANFIKFSAGPSLFSLLHNSDFESYQEGDVGLPGTTVQDALAGGSDFIEATRGATPSQPDADMELRGADGNTGDDVHIDVDIFIGP